MEGSNSELFSTVFQAIPCPSLLLHAQAPDFLIAAANEAYCNATGRSNATLVGQKLFDALPDNQANGVVNLRNSLAMVLQTHKPHELRSREYAIKSGGTKNHESRYWNVCNTPLPGADGAIDYIIHTVSDVTKEFVLKTRAISAERDNIESHEQLETALEKTEKTDETNSLLHAIIDTAQAGIFLFMPVYDDSESIVDFRFTEANKMLAAYLGQTPETVKGTLGSVWFPSYKANGLFDRLCQTAYTNISNRFEFHYDADSIDVWLDIMSTSVNDSILVTFTDHTAMKNLQRRLEEHVNDLRGSNANLEQFAYVASHDLQEPLRKVKSFGDMLRGRYNDALGPDGADLIARMQGAAARMSTLIDDLLTYSRASVKPSDLTIIDTNKVLEGVLFDLERAVVQKKAKIYCERLLPVAGQSTQIGQIFLNLIGNALKFSKPDTAPELTISLTVEKGIDSGIPMSAQDAEKQFQVIRIADNGIGFDQSYSEQIFQIFQRLNTRSEFPGSGVGLSIVKKVIENHGGYIKAVSAPGKGATFFVLLPMVEAKPQL